LVNRLRPFHTGSSCSERWLFIFSHARVHDSKNFIYRASSGL